VPSSESGGRFYLDELVWLYNGAGGFSLAQGQCYDGIAMCETGLRLREK